MDIVHGYPRSGDFHVLVTVMPYAALHKCPYPGCNVLVKSGRCSAHSTKNVERDPAVKKLYNSPQWKAMRAAQLAKDPWCVECLKRGEHVPATEADHIKSHHGEPVLFFDANNLQSLCESDHSRKTANEVWHSSHESPVEKSF